MKEIIRTSSLFLFNPLPKYFQFSKLYFWARFYSLLIVWFCAFNCIAQPISTDSWARKNALEESLAGIGGKAVDTLLVPSTIKKKAAFQYELGRIFLSNHDTTNAEKYFLSALDNYFFLKKKIEVTKIAVTLGELYLGQRDYEKCLAHFTKSLPIYRLQKDSFLIEKTAYQIGNLLMGYQKKGYYIQKSLNFYKEGIAISRTKKDTSGIFNRPKELGFSDEDELKLWFNIGYCYFLSDLPSKAIEFYEYHNLTNQRLNKPMDHIKGGLIRGRIYHSLGNYAAAMSTLSKTLQYCEEFEQEKYTAYTLNNIGLLNQDFGNFKEALVYHKEALDIRISNNDSISMAYSYFDLGDYYFNIGDQTNALLHYSKSIEICKAIHTGFIVNPLNKTSIIKIQQGKLKEAKIYLEEVEGKNPKLLGHVQAKTKFFLAQNDLVNALKYGQKAFELVEEAGNIKRQQESARDLEQIYSSLGDYKKAYQYALIKQEKTDSINQKEKIQTTQRLVFEFETERKDAALAIANQQQQLQEVKLQNQRYLLFSILALGLLMTAVAFSLYSMNKKNQNIAHQNKLLANQESRLREKMVNLFANISHELITPIALLKMPLEILIQKKQQQKNDILSFKMMLKNTNRLSELIHQMLALAKLKEDHMPINLVFENPLKFIYPFVESFSDIAKAQDLELFLHLPSKTYFIHYDEDALSKILSNLISNAIKYTEKGIIIVQFKYLEKDIELQVRDTGYGIDEEGILSIFERYYQDPLKQSNYSSSGLGLSLVKEIVTLYKGTIDVESKVGKGTVFTVRLPHNEKFTNEELLETSKLTTFNFTGNAIESFG